VGHGRRQAFFQWGRTVVGPAPEKVTTGEHDAYPRAIRETLGPEAQHQTSRYMNNRLRHEVALLTVGTLLGWDARGTM